MRVGGCRYGRRHLIFYHYEDRNAALSAKAKSDSKVKSNAPNSKTAKHNNFGLRWLSFGLCAIDTNKPEIVTHRLRQDGSKWGQNGPKMGPRWGQDGSKWATTKTTTTTTRATKSPTTTLSRRCLLEEIPFCPIGISPL